MAHKKNHACRYCGSTNLVQFLSLGEQPPSNSFIRHNQVPFEERYPLDVYFCVQCSLVQLLDVIAREVIFDDYMYLSSTSQALREHYAELAAGLTSRFMLQARDVVVDIGCNDGILLHGYPDRGLVKVGVEPSKVAEIASASGLNVMKAFFGPVVASEIARKHGTGKVVTATNVFAHVDDVGEFLDGLAALLDDEGVFVIEAPYLLDLIDQTLFDTVYHEHLCYLSLTPLRPLFDRYDMTIIDVERVPIGASGPALRVFVARRGSRHSQSPSVDRLIAHEAAWGVKAPNRYLGYGRRVEGVKVGVLNLIERFRGTGARVGAYGAPAKGNTLLNYFGLDVGTIECVAETNPLKIGLLTPGSHIPIVSEKEFLRRMPEYSLLLSWNYLDHFLRKSEYIRRGGRFIVPLPVPRIAPALGAAGEAGE